MALSLNRFMFQDEVVATGNGNELRVNNGEMLRVAISGTATARTVVFEGKGEVGDYVAIKGYNETTSVLSTTTSGTSDEIWVFDVAGLHSIRARVSTISGGSLSVKGKLVG